MNFPFFVTSAFGSFGNFVLSKIRMMEERIDIPAVLYEDEIVCFMADRYHTSTENVVKCFLVQDGICADQENESLTFCLEDNEMEILQRLTYGSHS